MIAFYAILLAACFIAMLVGGFAMKERYDRFYKKTGLPLSEKTICDEQVRDSANSKISDEGYALIEALRAQKFPIGDCVNEVISQMKLEGANPL